MLIALVLAGLPAFAADIGVDELGTGGLLITEVMPDPSAVGDTQGEWFEIHNPGLESVDLLGLMISDGSSTETVSSSVTIEAGGYVVVGVETDTASNGGVTVDIDVSFGLTNGGETLTLANDSGTIDAITWTTSSAGKSRTLDPDGFDAVLNDDESYWCNATSSYGDGDLGTPGAENDDCAGVEPPDTGDTGPITCDGAGDVVINEFMANPEGDDGGAEWVELYNNSASRLEVSGWSIWAAKSSIEEQVVLPDNTFIDAGGFLLIGGSSVADIDVVGDDLDMGTGTSGDLVQLVDCEGATADTVVYGSNNDDGWTDDSATVAVSLAPTVSEGVSIARLVDGFDTDLSGDDFANADFATPGQSNSTEPEPCVEDPGLVINEFVANPAGTDDGLEWIELFHAGTETLELADWALQKASSSSGGYSALYTFEDGVLEPGDYLVIGGDALDFTDIAVASFSLGNGSGTDALRIVDCNGVSVDTVLYGEDNEEDQLAEDDGTVPDAGAEAPGDDEALARIQDGWDTDVSRRDFLIDADPTPGAANPVQEPIECVPSDGSIVLNEVLVNPDGDDSGREFIELYNNSGSDLRIDGWYLSAETSGPEYDDVDIELPGGLTIPAEGFFVIGGELVAEADYADDFTALGNGSGTDGLRLFDCEGNPVDTVVYGDDPEDDGTVNPDGLVDDDEQVVEEPLATPGSGEVFARRIDGVDTNAMVDDWKLTIRQTPGYSNIIEDDTDTGSGPITGCGANQAPTGNTSGCGRTTDAPSGRGCATPIPPLAPGWLLIAMAAVLRRREIR